MTGDLTQDAFRAITSQRHVAWDIETNGLDPQTSDIGICQLFSPVIGACVVTDISRRPSLLMQLLESQETIKVFHHAPFDLSFMVQKWGVAPKAVACTKIAAKIISPDTDPVRYSLKYLMEHHFKLKLNKEMRFSDWMADSLTSEQLQYAVGDVKKLLDLYELLRETLESIGLSGLYEECCEFLPTHVKLKLRGCPDPYKY
ncbi:ribonuclease D [Streptomyces galbus]|uniref:Ribonuclease D n=2 Tax=Streptomyces galbus TaxID=33898 RepID=A0ABX1IMS5_STRGB|nr:ribonuclease D [Streptomyces galbus]